MQYTLLIYETTQEFSRRDSPVDDDYWAAWRVYTASLVDAGILVGGNALDAADTATTISGRGDKRTIHSGPFADSTEQLGGYYVVEVDDLDAAIALASRCPATEHGRVEIRPVLAMS